MIHQYKLNGHNIVIDTYSGSVHAVDDVAYDVISMFETADKEEIVRKISENHKNITDGDILKCIDDVAELKASGQLFAEDIYADKADVLKNKNSDIKALCLHVAHTCNLNCSYCFAAQGKYQGERALMSFEVGKRALDFLIENSGNRKILRSIFSAVNRL